MVFEVWGQLFQRRSSVNSEGAIGGSCERQKLGFLLLLPDDEVFRPCRQEEEGICPLALCNGRQGLPPTVCGGTAEYVKKSMAGGVLGRAEAPKISS